MNIALQDEHVVSKNPPVAGRDVATPAFPDDRHNVHLALAESFERFHRLVETVKMRGPSLRRLRLLKLAW
jgi:hypothetical protein